MARTELINPIRMGRKARKYRLSGVNGITGMLRAYTAGQIDRRTEIGMWITERENQLARHYAYDNYSAASPTLAGKIHLIIRQELFLSFYEGDIATEIPGLKENNVMWIPTPEVLKAIKASEILLSKLYTELGLKPKQKRIESFDEWKKKQEGSENEVS